jgi:hypothetical protein
MSVASTEWLDLEDEPQYPSTACWERAGEPLLPVPVCGESSPDPGIRRTTEDNERRFGEEVNGSRMRRGEPYRGLGQVRLKEDLHG